MKKSVIICILGMHRSGTSLLTRILNLMGVYLGPDAHLLQPLAENPKGFWEHEEIWKLNEDILWRLGGSWHNPPELSPGWESAAELEDLKERALTIIQTDFTDAGIWGWKDPRTCLTLPFWQQILPPMQYAICLRHPVEVARSLARRNDFSIGQGIYLWIVYVKQALENTRFGQRTLVFYENILNNWNMELLRLWQFLGKPELVDETEVHNLVRNFIDKDLRHHHNSKIELLDQTNLELPIEVVSMAEEVYLILQQENSLEQRVLVSTLQEALNIIDSLEMKKAWQQRIADRWMKQLCLASEEIRALIPKGETFIMVDEEQWGVREVFTDYRCIPFLEKDEQYWGVPSDDDEAISGLERLRVEGANFIVFGWPAFWWLDFYSRLRHHLQDNYSCLSKNDRIVIFALNNTLVKKNIN